jgi:hypothetical protein
MPPPVNSPAPVSRSPFVWLRNKFFAGLAVALPLLITFWVLINGYNLLHGLSEPAIAMLAERINQIEGRVVIDPLSATYKHVVNFVGFLIPVVVCVLLGLMATHVIGSRIVTAVDRLFMRVPIASFIYKMMKQVIDAFKGMGGRQNFKRVVSQSRTGTPCTAIEEALHIAHGVFAEVENARPRGRHRLLPSRRTSTMCSTLPAPPLAMTGMVTASLTARVRAMS